MIRVVVSGACGKMGKAVTEMIKTQEDMKAIAGFDIAFKEGDLTIYNDLNKIPETTDVIIDFSNPSIIKELTEYTVSKGVALAVGTTGLEEEHKRMLYSASKTIPVFVSHNMCLGVSLLLKSAKEAEF